MTSVIRASVVASTLSTGSNWLVHGEPEVMEAFLPVLEARGLSANLMPDRVRVDLLETTFAGGRPPGMPQADGVVRRPEE